MYRFRIRTPMRPSSGYGGCHDGTTLRIAVQVVPTASDTLSCSPAFSCSMAKARGHECEPRTLSHADELGPFLLSPGRRLARSAYGL
jgi:hypothetical protein